MVSKRSRRLTASFIFRAKNELYSFIDYQERNRNIVSALEKMAVPNSLIVNGIVVNLENVSGCQTTEGSMI